MKNAIEQLVTKGQTLGALDAKKSAFAKDQKYAEAKDTKVQLDEFRDKIYKELQIFELLNLPLPRSKPSSPKDGALPPATRHKGQRRSSIPKIEEPENRPNPEPRRPLPPPKIKYAPAQHLKSKKNNEDDEVWNKRDF